MPRLRTNILANLGGQSVSTIVSFLTTPIYLKLLGAEAFGIVGFLLTLQALVAILDFGMSAAANHAVSRRMAQTELASDASDLAKTLEVFYFAVAGIIAVAGTLVSVLFAESWFHETETLTSSTIPICLSLGITSIALRWPNSLYVGLMRGRELQVEINVISGAAVIGRGITTVCLLVFLTKDVRHFFIWQTLFSLAELWAFRVKTWAHFQRTKTSPRPRFSFSLLRQIWSFSTHVGGITLGAVILKQVDKILVSRLLPIESLGYYSAANLAANALTKLIQPVQVAAFPRLTKLHTQNATDELRRLFHQCCETTALVSAPFACAFIFFAHDILWLWTWDTTLTAEATPVMQVLAWAMLINCQTSVPYSLQLAGGITWLPLRINVAGAIISLPVTYLLIQSYGLPGAATTWLLFNLANFLIAPPIMFRRLLPGEWSRWMLRDVAPYVAVGLVCFGLASSLRRGPGPEFGVVMMAAATLAYGLAILALSSRLRASVRGFLSRLLPRRPAR